MSASEKLKAMSDAWRTDEWREGLTPPTAVLDALPEIVAVVEAMHRTAYAEINGAVDEYGRIWTRAEIQMVAIDDGRAALSALDEALA